MTATELDEAIDAYRQLHEAVPIPTRLPTEEEVATMEDQMALRFHPDLRRFLMRASDVNYGALACVVLTKPDSHRFLPRVCENAWVPGESPVTWSRSVPTTPIFTASPRMARSSIGGTTTAKPPRPGLRLPPGSGRC